MIQALIGKIVLDCIQHNISVNLSHTKEVRVIGESEDLGCSGFFGGNFLTVATDKPKKEWLKILLHEYNHFKQWTENKIEYEADNVQIDSLWQWLDNKCALSKKAITELTNLAMYYELDCEQRTVKMIKDIKDQTLAINTIDYIKQANTYLYLYPMIAKYRQWCTKKAPYLVKDLVAIMPETFLHQADYWDIPTEVEILIKKECFK